MNDVGDVVRVRRFAMKLFLMWMEISFETL
jgi:hypothetical protein